MRAVPTRFLLVVLWVLATSAIRAEAAAGDVVLVVANARHPWSSRVAAQYLAARGLPPSQLLTVDVSPDATVTHEVYQQAIERPLIAWLRTHDAFDRTHIIVLGPGLPLRIAGTPGRNGTNCECRFRARGALPAADRRPGSRRRLRREPVLLVRSRSSPHARSIGPGTTSIW